MKSIMTTLLAWILALSGGLCYDGRMSVESDYAMYVIGQVESGHDWASVNYTDPITVGMMQWYGNRAQGLLARGRTADPTGWDAFRSAAPTLAQQVEANNIDWNLRYLTRAEGDSWKVWAGRKENHTFQQAQWEDDFAAYDRICDSRGFPKQNIRERIYWMTTYHQGPRYAIQVLDSVSATATLDLLHAATLRHSVLGRYPTRYNTAYDMLKNWDGKTPPPDFGQSTAPSPAPGGNNPTISGSTDSLAWIENKQDYLYLHEGGKVRIFRPSAIQTWQESGAKGTEVDPGHQTNPGSGGSGPNQGAKVAEWVRQRLGKYDYSQADGRLDPDATGRTDCSGLWWRAYMDVTGVDVGTWTGAMAGKGTVVASYKDGSIDAAIPKVKAGDLLLLGHSGPPWDHVDGFAADASDQTMSHGGPGRGPVYRSAREHVGYFGLWEIRRYV